MGGADQKGVKRVKSSFYDYSEGLKTDLKGQVEDLKFIINHLKVDVNCTLENSVKQLKVTVEREIGLLVYSLMEESLREQGKLKDNLRYLERENSLLIENEGNIMDELARITLENEKEKLKRSLKEGNLDETVLKELKELEGLLYDNDKMLIMIKDLKRDKENDIVLLSNEQEKVIEYENIVNVKDNEILKLKQLNHEAFSKIDSISKELEAKNEEITELFEKIKELEKSKKAYDKGKLEDEEKIKDLMDMNNELMDLGEIGKKKEIELERQNFELEKENKIVKETWKEEIQSLKKVMTAQKIELEKGRETLNRERKLASLKISDLQEQIEELKNYKYNHEGADENFNNQIRN